MIKLSCYTIKLEPVNTRKVRINTKSERSNKVPQGFFAADLDHNTY